MSAACSAAFVSPLRGTWLRSVKDELVVRVGPNKYEDALEQPHIRPMNSYVFAAPSGMKSESSLKRWVRASVAHARTLPPKSSRGTDL
jgi:hypothetical protein